MYVKTHLKVCHNPHIDVKYEGKKKRFGLVDNAVPGGPARYGESANRAGLDCKCCGTDGEEQKRDLRPSLLALYSPNRNEPSELSEYEFQPPGRALCSIFNFSKYSKYSTLLIVLVLVHTYVQEE